MPQPLKTNRNVLALIATFLPRRQMTQMQLVSKTFYERVIPKAFALMKETCASRGEILRAVIAWLESFDENERDALRRKVDDDSQLIGRASIVIDELERSRLELDHLIYEDSYEYYLKTGQAGDRVRNQLLKVQIYWRRRGTRYQDWFSRRMIKLTVYHGRQTTNCRFAEHPHFRDGRVATMVRYDVEEGDDGLEQMAYSGTFPKFPR